MQLSSKDAALKLILEKDLKLFARIFFKEWMNESFMLNWHHELVFDALQKLVENPGSKNLAVCLPPGFSKSLILKLWTAWCYTRNSSCRFIYTSNSSELALGASDDIRAIMRTPLYIKMWGAFEDKDNSQAKSNDAKSFWKTTSGGTMRAVGQGGAVVGYDAGLASGRGTFTGALEIDDPLKPEDAYYELKREKPNRIYRDTLRSRRRNSDVPVVLIMQRVHVNDLIGYIEENEPDDWDIVTVPAIRDGECAWPGKDTIGSLKKEREKNPYMFEAQYMQSPMILGGDIIHGEWFNRYTTKPEFKEVIISADTATSKESVADYSVFQCWGKYENKAYLIDQIRGKWEFPDLERKMVDFYNKHSYARHILVEKKSSGIQLIQNIKRNHGLPIKGVPADKARIERVASVVGKIEAGYVYLPENAQYVSGLIGECESFTANDTHKHDDQIDPMVYALQYLLNAPKVAIVF